MSYVDCVGLLFELSYGDSEPAVDYHPIGEANEMHRLVGVGRFDDATIPEGTGFLETILEAIGEVDNAIGGYRITRLLDPVAVGDTVLPVESVQEWEDSGRVFLDGVVYHYTGKGLGSLHGITHIFHGEEVIGVRKTHARDAAILDLGNPYNAIQTIRRSMLVEYAEDNDLTIIGRNLGVYRYPYMDSNETYRKIISALAYNPRGTMLGIRTILDAILGEGNYILREHLQTNPCTVYVIVAMALLAADRSIGHAYMGDPECPLAEQEGGIWQLVPLSADPVDRGVPASLCWRDHDFLHEFITSSRPSALTIIDYDGDAGTTPWVWVGANETGKVTPNPPDYVQITEDAGDSTGYYRMRVRAPALLPELFMDWAVSMNFCIDSGHLTNTTSEQWGVQVLDGDRAIGWGLKYISGAVHLVACSGSTVVFDYGAISTDVFHEVQIIKRKVGTYGDTLIEIQLDGVLQGILEYGAFSSASPGSSPWLGWGSFMAAATDIYVKVRSVGVYVHTYQDFMEYIGVDGSVSASDPDHFSVTAALFNSADIGHHLQTINSGITNGYGGNNNGLWQILTRISDTEVTVRGATGTEAAVVESLHPKRITIPSMPEVFTYPNDLGRQIVLSGSSQGNDGTYVIQKLLQAGSLVDLATYLTPGFSEKTNVCEVVSASFLTEGDLDFVVNPNFSTESNLPFFLSAASPVVDVGGLPHVRTRMPLPTCEANRSVQSAYSRVLTGQVLYAPTVAMEKTQDEPVEYSHYPFYITDPLGTIRKYLSLVTAAGVIPEYLVE